MLRTLCHRSTAFVLLAMLLTLAGSNLHAASVGDPEIKTDDTYFPGELAMSTLPRILIHANGITRGTVGSATNRDKLIKAFLWRSEHFTHLDSPELYKVPGQTPNPSGGNTLITEYDTMRAMFSYGWGVCGTNHAQFRAIAEEAGWTHRRRGLNGDTGQEIGFGGLWRYVNTDQYTLHFLSNSASADFASLDQVTQTGHRYIEWNPDLGGGYKLPQAPTHGGYHTATGSVIPSIPLRSSQWQDYYDNVWSISVASSIPMYAEGYCSTPIAYRLKRGETFTRWLKPDGVVTDLSLAGRCWWGFNRGGSPHAAYSFSQNAPARDQLVSGPEESQKGGGMDNGNGCFDWQPSLSNSEHVDGLYSSTGTFVVGGSPVLKATTAATMVFEFTTPYTICGRPTQNNGSGHLDPALVCADGAMLYTTHTGTITLDVSNDMGATWTSKGALADTVDFTDLVKARNTYLLRFNFNANAGLNTLHTRTITMLAQSVYPTLKSGTTNITYANGKIGMLELSPSLMTAAGASSVTGSTTLVSDSGMTYDGYAGNYAYTQSINGGAWMIWKISLPPELANSGATFKQIFAAQDSQVGVPPNPGTTGTIEIGTSATGPWTNIANYAIPTDNQLSHFWTYGRSLDATNLNGTTWYVRFTTNNASRSSQAFRYLNINATYNLPTPTSPMDVTYYWNNGTSQTNTHTIPAGTVNTSWSIATGTIASQSKVVFSVPSGGVAAPVITTQPSDQTVTVGSPATFTVVASGTGPFTYQWKKGVSPVGTNSATYTIGSTVLGDAGTYTVDVTNAGGTVTSNPATLTVNSASAPPTITTQPSDQTVTAGSSATFTVVATGPGVLSYQWKKGVTPVGTNSPTYTIGSTVVGDAGSYTVDVTNANGTVTSNPATLTVNVVTTTTVTFQQGVASYTGTVDTYLDAIAPNDTNSFGTLTRVDVNYFGGGTSENTLALFKFDLSSIPAGSTVTAAQLDVWVYRTNSVDGADQLVMSKVTSTWDNNSTYAGGVPTTVPSGVTPPSVGAIPNSNSLIPEVQYTIPGMAALVQSWVTAPAGNFGLMLTCASNINFRIASSEYGTATLRPKLTVTYSNGAPPSGPTITTQPASQTVTQNSPVTFSVVASGTGVLTYQWRKGTTPIGGATSSTYTIASAQLSDAGGYNVIVTDTNGSTTSGNAVLTVNALPTGPTINTQPGNQTVTQGNNATFSVSASGTGVLTYQWRKGTTPIGGATSSSYTVVSAQPADAGSYNVIVTDSNGSTTSNNATLTVNAVAAPTITTDPLSQTKTVGQNVTFTVVATGTGLSYQWRKGTTPIGGATSASYTITGVVLGDAGNYNVVVTNAGGSVTSANGTLTVNAAGNPITPSTSTLNFTAPTGSTTNQTQTLTLTNTSGVSVTVTPASSQTWMTTGAAVTIAAGSTGTIAVTVNPTALTGNNTANLTLTNSTGGSQVLTVNLNILASSGNPITASVATVSLGAPVGSITPVTTTFTLTNTSGGPITVTPSSATIWLGLSGPVTIPAGGSATVTVTGNPAGLTGINNGSLTLTNSTGGTQTIPVSFSVGTTAGLRKRGSGCSVSTHTNTDAMAWIFGLVVLAGLTTVLRRRTA